MTRADQFDYRLFGLTVRSEIALPELCPVATTGGPDVTIAVDNIDLAAGEAGLSVVDDALLLTIDRVGRFLIRGGSHILVDPIAGTDPRNVRLFLLGSAFGALLHQRGLLPLHANAIDLGGQVVAFMGASGAGKSTLAAWFHDHGHQVLADDVCVVDFAPDGRALVNTGIPRLRLWMDAIHRSGRSVDGLQRSYIESDLPYDKFDVPIFQAEGAGARPLGAIYQLERGEAFQIERLQGVDAMRTIYENIYRGGWLSLGMAQQEHWQTAVRLAQSTPLFRVFRRWDPGQIDIEAELLKAHARQHLDAVQR